jgi:hypothetical protein
MRRRPRPNIPQPRKNALFPGAWLVLAAALLSPGARAEPFVTRPDAALLPRGNDAIEALRRPAKGGDSGGLEQVLVLPQRPGRNKVRWYGFDWRRYDYLDDAGVGGVRFYFYEREAGIARTAAAMVREQYEELSQRFNFRPMQRIPYILYNSHREFENTNVFFVSEGVLGVTSPQDLRMALPYWGETELFRHVSTHEMVHQFTIQKMAERAAAAGTESGISQLPLWFIEGLAEYYSQHGIDRETDMFARDLLLNARPELGYALIGFWDDDPGSFIYTYKLGQLRVAFLAEEFGERVVQGVLDQSPRLGLPRALTSPAPAGDDTGRETFETLLGRLTGEAPDNLALRFAAWLKRRYLPAYLEARQEPPALLPVQLPGEPDAFSAGRDGFTLLYRAVERETGRSRLFLADRRHPQGAVLVAADGVPGLESLHPVLRRVTAVGDRQLAFLARHGSADSLYVATYERRFERGRPVFSVGPRQRLDLVEHDLIEAGDPAFSPDGARVAFFALDGAGQIDLWTADLASGALTRLTNDRYAERDLAWSDEPPSVYGLPGGGEGGTLVYATDATPTRRWNLEALDPATGDRRRLTDEPADQRAPAFLGGGLVAFSSDARGKQDLHLYDASTGRVRRLTDFVTGLSSPSPGPRGLSALAFFGGRYQVFDVPTESLLEVDERPAIPGALAPPAPFPEEPIPENVPEYQPLARENWRLENGVAAVGSASVGQGTLLFGDVLGDRSAIVQFAVYGSLSLTDALAFYADRSGRDVRGAGLFHTFTQRRDPAAPGFGTDVLYVQREYGLTGSWIYPFDTFSRVEARATAQGIDRSFQYPLTPDGLSTPFVSTAALRAWRESRSGFDLEALGALRFGWDTTAWRFPSGPSGGASLLAEVGVGYLPLRTEAHAYGWLDAQQHWRLFGATLHLRLAAGASGGSVFARQFFLSSYDNLRGFNFSDRRLLGTAYAVTNLDLHVPLDALIRLALVTNVQGVLGLDFGGVSSAFETLWAARTLAPVVGFNVGLGPFLIRVHWAYPLDIGGDDLGTGWVPNVSLRYAYF